jgi:hypothetical protein
MTSERPERVIVKWLEAINSGSLDEVKAANLCDRDINRIHHLPAEVRLQPKYTKDRKVVSVDRPTLLMVATICEQDEILEYFLANYNINLGILSGDNHHLLHVAAMVADYRPLQILLRFRYLQENRDVPCALPGQVAQENQRTTALHLAVSHGNLPHVFLLLTQYDTRPFEKPEKPSEPSDQEPKQLLPVLPNRTHHAAGTGSTPLHIAVDRGDVAIVRTLLAYGAEASDVDAKNESVSALAERLRAEEAEKIKRRIADAERNNYPYDGPLKSPWDRICELLVDGNEDAEQLRHELAPQIEIPVGRG